MPKLKEIEGTIVDICSKINLEIEELQTKQEEIIKKHNSLAVQYAELEHLKNSMNEYFGRNKAEKKESVIGAIKSQQIEYMDKHKEKKEVSKEVER